jgi:hypothetical protein
MQTSQNYIFCILQHFVTKVCNFTDFNKFFTRIWKKTPFLPKLKISLTCKLSIWKAISISELDQNFKSVKFINLSVSSLGVFDKECHTFVKMLNVLGLDNQHQQYCIRKMIYIAIGSMYYIFCCRNKEWTNPKLMNI